MSGEMVAEKSVASPLESRLGHLPALDGVRGLAVIIVLLYHHSITWMTGGELTVSMFFTLSGFLITRLMVNEWNRTGTVSLRKFYERRARRLFPASFAVLLAVVIIWTLFPGSGRRLAPWEWMSGLAYFENIYLQSAGKDYAGLFGFGNPLQHLWSLSLEEQVYLVFPILSLLLLRRERTRRLAWRLFVVFGAVALGAIALGAYYRSNVPLWSELPLLEARCSDSSCAYYATEVRMGEFFMGAAFAVLWSVWNGVPRLVRALQRPLAAAVSWPILAGAFIIWFKVGWRNEWSEHFFPWAVLVNALVTLVLIAFAVAGSGMCRFLGWKPMAWLGQVTYTIYLVHWPMFLLWETWRLDPNLPRWRVPGTDWVTVDKFWMFMGKAGSTMVVVCLLYYLLENPVRYQRLWKGKKLFLYLGVMALIGSVVAFGGREHRLNAGDILSTLDADALAMQQQALADLADLPPDAPTRSAVDIDLPARVFMVGDSQSWVLASGLDPWERDNAVIVQPSPGVGCGIGGNTRIRYLGVEQDARPGCTQWRDALRPIADKFRPNLTIIVGGAADLSDRVLPGSNNWSHIGQEDYDEWLTEEFATFVDSIHVPGTPIIWFSTPDIDPLYIAGETGIPPFVESDPERTRRYNQLIAQYAASDDRVVFADFAMAVRAHPGGQFEPKMRPDRAHIDLAQAPDLVAWIDRVVRDVLAEASR